MIIKEKSKVAFEKDWQKTANYAYNDAILTQHIAKHCNYGVMPRDGLCVFDCDNVHALAATPFYTNVLINTFAVKTGRDKDKKTGNPQTGTHFYFNCTELPSEKYVLKQDGIEVGDIRGSGSPFYVVGPGSIHPDTGKEYVVVNDVEPITVEYDALMEFINSSSNNDTPVEVYNAPFNFPKMASSKTSIANQLGVKVEDVLMPLNPRPRGHQIEGNHPVHGGNTGTNLIIDPLNNVWWCRHHNTGGGPMEAFAVAEGILDCSYFVKGNPGHWTAIISALKKSRYAKSV